MTELDDHKPIVPPQNSEKPFLRHKTEYYDPDGNPIRDYLFHPATLTAMRVLGEDALTDLVPQGGFDEHIPQMQLYNERMSKSMADKVDYLERIKDAEIIIDFGCADGKLLKYLQSNDPSKHYIGYDISQPMLDLAQVDNPDNITFTDDWDSALEKAKAEAETRSSNTTLVISSLLHEIYAYLPEEDIKEFWHKVYESGFDNIAIRDMMTNNNIDRDSNPEDVQKIRDNYDSDKIDEWEERWGSLDNNKSMTHFLLTCPYKENWARELQENYLPMPMQELISNIPPEYEVAFVEHYTLPYFKDKTQENFGITVNDNTHMKLILQKTTRDKDEVEQDKSNLIVALNETPSGTVIAASLTDDSKLDIQTRSDYLS